jgi:fluoride exporter
MQLIFAIAAGGALGAVARHYVAARIAKTLAYSGFPYGTLAVNMLGSLLMGILITAFALKFEASQELRGFLTVGLLGSFTTFSTFSLEGALLIQRGDWQGAALYMVGSLVLGLAFLFAGMWLGKIIL